jgi:TolB-like protein
MKKILMLCIAVLFFPPLAFSQNTVAIDAALRNSTSILITKIPANSKVVVLNCTSIWPLLSDYIIEELIGYIVNEGTKTVVDRKNLDAIRQEMAFQASGEVSDETAQSIGKKLGAQIIVSGSITAIGGSYRLRVKAISVETAQIFGMESVDVIHENRIAALTGTAYKPSVSNAQNNGNILFQYLPNNDEMSVVTDISSPGGKSTGSFNITKERIEGIDRTVLNTSIALNRGIEYPWGLLSISSGRSIVYAKAANRIRFKVLGDGQPWRFEVCTREVMDSNFYQHKFDTYKNMVTTIDIPFSVLRQVEWAKHVEFNKSSIYALQFNLSQADGIRSSSIKLFDIEFY